MTKSNLHMKIHLITILVRIFSDLDTDLSDVELVNNHGKGKQSIISETELLSVKIKRNKAAV